MIAKQTQSLRFDTAQLEANQRGGCADEQTRIGSSRKEALIAAAVFLFALSLYRLSWFYGIDGGVSTVGAERVLAGEVPYRDFWTMYAPGQFYLLALLFRVFGAHLLVEVVAASVVSAAATWLCYRLVLTLTSRRLAALACAAIFLAAMYNTGYFKGLGSYPTGIFFVFAALNFMVIYCRSGKLVHMVAAGLATGAVATFKHDVGGYTALAIVAGLAIYHIMPATVSASRGRSLMMALFAFSGGVVVIVLPWLIYFAVVAGYDMLQDLIVFPLTDFRFARPEGYPSLLPFGIFVPSRFQTFVNLINYLNFAVPFVLFLSGLLATVLAARRNKPEYAALGVTFSVGFLFHYVAAHIQINTHIITMSAYSACLGALLYDLVQPEFAARGLGYTKWGALLLVVGWLLSLAAQPAYLAREKARYATSELRLEKVAGFKVNPEEARALEELAAFVSDRVPPDQKLYVGLHRHDVIVIGDVMIYFILDRPSATRYHELHPAIADTAGVQQEIVGDLRRHQVSLIILKNIFSDQTLEPVKRDFLKNLPNIGATDLDEFIRANYVPVRQFGRYVVWQREAPFASAPISQPVSQLTRVNEDRALGHRE